MTKQELAELFKNAAEGLEAAAAHESAKANYGAELDEIQHEFNVTRSAVADADKSLLAARTEARKIVSDAEKDAKGKVATAQARAEKIVKDAQATAEQLYAEANQKVRQAEAQVKVLESKISFANGEIERLTQQQKEMLSAVEGLKRKFA